MIKSRLTGIFHIRRTYSTAVPTASIYVSTSTSPYFNLSVEDWLFRKAPANRPLLFLYRNIPCVIIGRNQNPWKEINFPALRRLSIPFLRRRSGGGTVYHDLGNTNFSIHLPRASFDRNKTARIVNRSLLSLGIDAEINERNDICVGKFKMTYKIVNTRAYHHGTMLISTDLSKLGNVLRNTKDTMITKGVASVRSPVHNLQQFKPNVTHSAFQDAVIKEFIREYDIDSEVQLVHDGLEMRNLDYIKEGIIELQQWDWLYGQTPEFTYKFTHTFPWGEVTADIRSKHGVILSCELSSPEISQAWCQDTSKPLVGVKYGTLEGRKSPEGEDSRRQDVLRWIMDEM